MKKLDRLLLGDSPFFGTGPVSEARARQQLLKFKDNQAILEVIDDARTLGIKSFMCTTSDRIGEICDHARAHPGRYRDLIALPCMPHAHKYANAVGEHGILETIKRFSTGGLVSTLFRGAMGALNQDIYELMKLLVDAEMKRFEGLHTPVVFVQNVVTDMLLGMKVFDVFGEFHRYVWDKYRAEAGFVTMNLPALLDALEVARVDNPIVCASVNKLGFRMSGGVAAYEQAIRERRFRCVAMGVFAGGVIHPEAALDYVCRQTRIESIVFGASSKAHLEHTQQLVAKLDAKYAGT